MTLNARATTHMTNYMFVALKFFTPTFWQVHVKLGLSSMRRMNSGFISLVYLSFCHSTQLYPIVSIIFHLLKMTW